MRFLIFSSIGGPQPFQASLAQALNASISSCQFSTALMQADTFTPEVKWARGFEAIWKHAAGASFPPLDGYSPAMDRPLNAASPSV